MKFLFIVQGEGREHLTQAVTLEEMLIRRGHEVVEILVGGSSSQTLAGVFNRSVHAPVKRFVSPKYLAADADGNIHPGKAFVHNILHIPEYIRSMYYINRRIRKTRVDAVVNFCEILTGFTYVFFRPSVPYISVGREYTFLHNDFEFPKKSFFRQFLMRMFIRFTSLRAKKRLGLSLREMPFDPVNKVVAVPPLMRQEVTSISPEAGDYIHGYLTNPGMVEETLAFHEERPDIRMRFFWNNPDADETVQVDKTLSFSQNDETARLNAMAGCRAYAGIAGFEPMCEAMFLGKPMLLVPTHIGQECNAYDAARMGAGLTANTFALPKLWAFAESFAPDREFVYWVRSCERRIVSELENLAQPLPVQEMALFQLTITSIDN